MALMVGVILALVIGVFATAVRLDKDRAFYPTVMIVIASYYGLFAVMGASTQALVLELLVGAGFRPRGCIWFQVNALDCGSGIGNTWYL